MPPAKRGTKEDPTFYSPPLPHDPYTLPHPESMPHRHRTCTPVPCPPRAPHAQGRITPQAVFQLLPDEHSGFGCAEYEYYLCGPAAFMQSLGASLHRRGVPPALVHAQFFGPAVPLVVSPEASEGTSGPPSPIDPPALPPGPPSEPPPPPQAPSEPGLPPPSSEAGPPDADRPQPPPVRRLSFSSNASSASGSGPGPRPPQYPRPSTPTVRPSTPQFPRPSTPTARGLPQTAPSPSDAPDNAVQVAIRRLRQGLAQVRCAWSLPCTCAHGGMCAHVRMFVAGFHSCRLARNLHCAFLLHVSLVHACLQCARAYNVWGCVYIPLQRVKTHFRWCECGYGPVYDLQSALAVCVGRGVVSSRGTLEFN